MDASRALNIVLALVSYVLRLQRPLAWPIAVKVDITPLCNLKCTICVHARPSKEEPELNRQSFNKSQLMSVGAFGEIVDQIRGRTSAISMYYLGDPMMHPHLSSMCRLAANAKLNTHVSTNLSFRLSDEKIVDLVCSGLTHLTVCVDGLSQKAYGLTRVGGRVDLVLSNLERIVHERQRLQRTFPKIEVQFIKFKHNVHELPQARKIFEALGVDQVTEFWGSLGRATSATRSEDVKNYLGSRALPRCFWPFLAMQIKYNGDAIPCCSYRQMEQYSSGDSRVVGNVLEDGVQKVWKSEPYSQLRRLSRNPEAARKLGALSESFCDGCDKICTLKVQPLRPRGDTGEWENYFYEDAKGHVFPAPVKVP